MQFFDNGADRVWAEKVISGDYQGYPGVVHGGVQSAILDEIVGRISLVEDMHNFMVAAKMEVRFRKPVPVDVLLRFEARRQHLSANRGRATGEILLPDGSVGSEAALILVRLPDEVRERATEEELGWRVCTLEP